MNTIPSHRHPFSHSLRPLALLVPLLAIATSAVANEVEEVVVTATKRDQRLQDVAGSVTVITRLDAINNLSDIAAQVPGFTVLDAGSRNPSSLTIRGLRFDEVGDNDFGGDGGSVATYVDNIPLQGFFVPPQFTLKDLQQVEVLRGPQGTLYGNASTGGLVRYVTAKPDLSQSYVRLGAGISQTAESDDLNYDTDLVVNSPLTDTVGLRLLLSQTENQGFIDNPYALTGPTKDINDDKTEAVRLSALWQATDAFSLAGSYHYQKVNVDDRQAANEAFTGDEYQASHRFPQFMEGKWHLYGIDAEYQFDTATLTASVNRYDYETVTASDQTDLFLSYYDAGSGYFSSYDDFIGVGAGNVEVKKDSAEIRLASDNDQPLRWLIGGFYSQDDLDVLIADFLPGFADFWEENRPLDLDYIATQSETLKEFSTFGELSYDLTAQWEVTLGARHFRYDDKLDSCYALFPLEEGETEIPLDCSASDDVQTGTLGKFSTRYRFTEQHQAYFLVSEGYRRGGANLVPAGAEDYAAYDPDTALNYELGTKTAWFNQRLLVNAAVFYMDWKDIQVQSYIEDFRATVNAGDARSQGVELETKAILSDRWSVNLGYSFTEAELTETVESITGSYENAYSGDRLPGSPKQQWNLGVSYAQPIGEAALDASLQLSHIGDVYTALNDEFYNYSRLDAYTTANARINVSLRNWHFGAFVTNIANERGVTGIRTDEFYGERGQFEYVTRPRTVGVSARYQF
ncbi:TonB-dependent receptor [Cellvibrio japonicus]|uniref:Putative TonB-dependent receptor n=1 Tax=Cellvibrio japonicus (strain Ueda107) TaxID=498211 RepID=B3PEJ6_CELJU|nr:TonB-dependent receptor [Cellvibrio japonicus]ACE83675.1 putative TonB-dependent receptor [Cellvibrio japonicus Ueda107]QEI13555.1 TonB-dependent receptor [Cellvibrio japonicus]QEI17129.1 TonB-dependent receptor [Cellvibrio japonicus]QEI20706.1 TonB-dependent receptor [Cellvibrio japonicus]